MEAILGFFDTSTKRWLAMLAAAFFLFIAFLFHSFMSAMYPGEATVTVEQAASGESEPAAIKTDPTWSQPQQVHATQEHQTVERVSPFDVQASQVKKSDPVLRQQIVHQQADYLRKLVADGKLPVGLGHLTKEQIDDMEKRGITIQ